MTARLKEVFALKEAFAHPPALGEPAEKILSLLLGYAPQQVTALHERKVM
jgi:hypothetical protein